MRKLFTFNIGGNAQAGLVKDLIEKNGMPCVIRNDQLSAPAEVVQPFLGDLRGFDLHVHGLGAGFGPGFEYADLILDAAVVAPVILVAPAGTCTAAGAPTAWIRPLLTSTVACSSGGRPVPSMTRAPTRAVTAPGPAGAGA